MECRLLNMEIDSNKFILPAPFGHLTLIHAQEYLCIRAVDKKGAILSCAKIEHDCVSIGKFFKIGEVYYYLSNTANNFLVMYTITIDSYSVNSITYKLIEVIFKLLSTCPDSHAINIFGKKNNGIDCLMYIDFPRPIVAKNLQNCPCERLYFSSCYHKNSIYIFGGLDETTKMNDMWKLTDTQWTEINQYGDLPPPIFGAPFVSYEDSVYLYVENSLYRYDYMWRKIHTNNYLNSPRVFTSTYIDKKTLFIIGGLSSLTITTEFFGVPSKCGISYILPSQNLKYLVAKFIANI